MNETEIQTTLVRRRCLIKAQMLEAMREEYPHEHAAGDAHPWAADLVIAVVGVAVMAATVLGWPA